MKIQMREGVFFEGRPLMPPEIHEVPESFGRQLISEGRAVLAPNEPEPPPPKKKGVRFE